MFLVSLHWWEHCCIYFVWSLHWKNLVVVLYTGIREMLEKNLFSPTFHLIYHYNPPTISILSLTSFSFSFSLKTFLIFSSLFLSDDLGEKSTPIFLSVPQRLVNSLVILFYFSNTIFKVSEKSSIWETNNRWRDEK